MSCARYWSAISPALRSTALSSVSARYWGDHVLYLAAGNVRSRRALYAVDPVAGACGSATATTKCGSGEAGRVSSIQVNLETGRVENRGCSGVPDGFRTRNLLSQSQGKTFEPSGRYSLHSFLLRNPSRAGDRDKLSG